MSVLKVLISGLIFFVITGCGRKQISKLSEDKTSDIMIDIALADVIINLYGPDDRDSIRSLLSQSLLEIHNITQSELDTNLYLFMSDFEKFDPLTDQMLEKYKKRSENLKQSAELDH